MYNTSNNKEVNYSISDNNFALCNSMSQLDTVATLQ